MVSQAWGWSFRHDSGVGLPQLNSAAEFVYLTDVSTRGLTASGDGTLRVTTPKGSYPARSFHDVVAGPVTKRVKADGNGRLTFKVKIGEPGTRQQLDFPASGPPANMPRVDVSIAPVRRPAHGSSNLWLAALAAIGAAVLSFAVIRGCAPARRAITTMSG